MRHLHPLAPGRLTGGKGALLTAVLLAFLHSPGAQASAWVYPTAMFYHDTQPTDPLSFNRGKLGIVLPGYEKRFLIVAYRWMKGLPLDPRAAERLLPSPADVDERNNPQKGVVAWQAARRSIMPSVTPTINPEKENPALYNYIPNCLGDAFSKAADTLNDRKRQYGSDRASIREWVSGQDKVFSNCEKVADLPGILPSNAPAWLLKDRAYQIAAAQFYQGDFPAALHGFAAIAQDARSPWRNIAAYLVARTRVRMALMALDENNRQDNARPLFRNPAIIREAPPISDAAWHAYHAAKASLRTLLHNPSMAAWHDRLHQLENHLDSRFKPVDRLVALEKNILAPTAPQTIWQDVRDFVFLNDREPQETDLGRWLNDSTRPIPNRPFEQAAAVSARQGWSVTHSLPWLWRALADATSLHQPNQELLSAAAAVPSSSPAYLSIQYFRLVGLRQSGRLGEARALAIKLLQRPDLSRSDRNLILDQRLFVSGNLSELVKFGTQPIVAVIFPGAEEGYIATATRIRQDKDLNWRPELQRPNPAYFSPGAAHVMNRAVPYRMLYDVLEQPLARHNKQNIALAAWTRGWLLGDTDHPVRLIPYLAPTNPDIGALLERYKALSDPLARQFVAAVVILSLPGATPLVPDGLGRAYSADAIGLIGPRYWTPVSLVENVPDCLPDNVEGICQWPHPDNDASTIPPFLRDVAWRTARVEARRMAAAGSVTTATGRVVLAWVKSHPEDPLVPQALHLIVRAGHYADSGDCDSNQIVRDAFIRLHRDYPASDWTRQTPRWYANGYGCRR